MATAGVKMIEQQVKEAIDEFGELAHERFMVDNVDIVDNSHLLLILEYNRTLKLKPLPELFEHDVSFYGADAYVMWEWKISAVFASQKWHAVDCIGQHGNIYLKVSIGDMALDHRRKTSAALPFDIERAIAGDAVGILCNGEWVDFDSCGCKVNWDYPDVDYSDYRMKYPKAAK